MLILPYARSIHLRGEASCQARKADLVVQYVKLQCVGVGQGLEGEALNASCPSGESAAVSDTQARGAPLEQVSANESPIEVAQHHPEKLGTADQLNRVEHRPDDVVN